MNIGALAQSKEKGYAKPKNQMMNCKICGRTRECLMQRESGGGHVECNF